MSQEMNPSAQSVIAEAAKGLDQDRYLELCYRTESPNYNPLNVSSNIFHDVLGAFVSLGYAVNEIKKAMFYGRPLDRDYMDAQLRDAIRCVEGAVMRSSNLRSNRVQSLNPRIVHGILGKATEAGEMAANLLAAADTGKFDLNNLHVEMGDSRWYDAPIIAGAREIDPLSDRWTSAEINGANIIKLARRFPDQFTEADAYDRDEQAEDQAVADAMRNDAKSPDFSKLAEVILHADFGEGNDTEMLTLLRDDGFKRIHIAERTENGIRMIGSLDMIVNVYESAVEAGEEAYWDSGHVRKLPDCSILAAGEWDTTDFAVFS